MVKTPAKSKKAKPLRLKGEALVFEFKRETTGETEKFLVSLAARNARDSGHLDDDEMRRLDEAQQGFELAIGRIIAATDTCSKSDALDALWFSNAIYTLSTKARHVIKQSQRITAGPHAAKMRAARASISTPEIERRQALLESSGFNLGKIVEGSKEAAALESDYARICKQAGIKPVGYKTLKRDAKAILDRRASRLNSEKTGS
jgi:hypothetical protein